MQVLVIGSGGREHALVWKISQSSLVCKIFCAPGNPGIGELAENVPIKVTDLAGLLKFAKEKEIELTVVGPEDPLVQGIVDLFKEAGLKIFGPDKLAAQLEGSKVFSKNLMKKYDIPTANYEVFSDLNSAKEYVNHYSTFPVVLKASGLAAGKGVIICQNKEEALRAIDMLMVAKIYGAAGDHVVIEEFLQGEEVSVFVLTDGKKYKILTPSQDHKKALDGDEGLNTGGMGAYAPTPVLSAQQLQFIEKSIIQKTLYAMNAEGIRYRGLLYIGLILTVKGAQVLEYNCRFGDPESEVVLPLLKSDLVPLLMATIDGGIDRLEAEHAPGFAVDVVMASGGYPGKYETGKVITGLDKLDKDILVFHAGTAQKDGQLVAAGGRVLNIVAVGENFQETREHLYDNIKRIHFDGMHYRKDIGTRAVKYY